MINQTYIEYFTKLSLFIFMQTVTLAVTTTTNKNNCNV